MSEQQRWAKDYLIFQTIAGSHAYGTNTPTSDIDKRGVFIAPRSHSMGCMFGIEQVEIPGEDTVIYELAKFLKLAAECNPNIIELLYMDDNDVLNATPAWKKITSNRHLFLSKKAKFTFSGYAMSQLKRIKGHNKWINNVQPENAPNIKQYTKIIITDSKFVYLPGEVFTYDTLDKNYSEQVFKHCFLIKVNDSTYRIYKSNSFNKPIISEDGQQIQFVDISNEKLLERAGHIDFMGILIFNKEAYKKAHIEWKQYWHWKKNRNKARSALEEKCGYDSKHALHLIRLLKMSNEILDNGTVQVKRADAKELLSIRNGKYTYEEIIAMAETMEADLEDKYKKCKLPHSSDKNKINELYIEIVDEFWKKQ